MREHDTIILNCDLPEHGLKNGDIGAIVFVHEDGAAYEVEFVALDGRTVALITLRAADLRATTPLDMPHARQIAV